MLKLLLKQTSPEDVTTVVLNIPGGRIFPVKIKYINVMRTYSKHGMYINCTSQARVPSLEPPPGIRPREKREREGEMIKLNTIE